MKKTKTFVAGMSLLLVLGLAGCGAEVPADSASVTKPDPIINVIPVDKTVKVEVGAVEGASVVLSGEGKQADGSFLPGSKAIAEITVTTAGKTSTGSTLMATALKIRMVMANTNSSFRIPTAPSR